MLEELISRLFTLLNAGSYYRSSLEIQNAINSASGDMYLAYRGLLSWYRPNNNIAAINFGETTDSTDALSECYQVFSATGDPLVITPTGDFIIDKVLVLEPAYAGVTDGSAAKFLPDNQWKAMVRNKVVPPTVDYPYCRTAPSATEGDAFEFTFNLLPSTYASVSARCLCYPPDCAFSFVDNNSPVPDVVVTRELIWQPDKIENLLARTISKLGFNIQNGVLIQAGNQMEQKVG